MEYAFIVNPRANGAGRGFLDRFEESLRARKIDYRLIPNARPGAGAEMARAAVALGAGTVVAVGGDGTINEVLNGISGETAFGIIPAGTCNDAARNLGVPRDWRQALEVVVAGRTVRADVGRCGDRRFLTVAGAGLDSFAALVMNRLPAPLRRPLVYAPILAAQLLTHRPMAFRLVVDGAVLEPEAWMIAVANTQAYGGGMRIAPAARMDDGRLHVCVVVASSRLEIIRNFPSVYSGRHLDHPAVRMYQAQRSVELACPRRCPVIADGEHVGWLPATFTIEARSVSLLVP
jgi:YegS/Rv2252/BmrU family lipid kinase